MNKHIPINFIFLHEGTNPKTELWHDSHIGQILFLMPKPGKEKRVKVRESTVHIRTKHNGKREGKGCGEHRSGMWSVMVGSGLFNENIII